ncbi:MAG: WG repeat-containing protein [Alphaproteobacteria bacterium]|nr:WG repeat-containing protein [Alphaproteobacteria bacterium]
MRKTLYIFGLLALAVIAFIFVKNSKKEFISFSDVTSVVYNDRGHNKNVEDEFVRVVKDNKWGVAKKKNGELVIPMEYDYIDNFYEGYAVVKKDEDYGTVDEKFNIVIQPKWKNISPFHLGYAVVVAPNGKSGVIDVNGKVIIAPLYYDYISLFDNNFVARAENFKDKKAVAIDLKGNIVKDFSKK